MSSLSRSPSSGKEKADKRNAPRSPTWPSRTYADGPLPIKPSDNARANARIVSRVIDNKGAWYSVKIGEVEINDVGLHEILEYVSSQHLEEYENLQFEEQAELERIAGIEHERWERENQERRKKRAKTKGTVVRQDLDGTDDGLVANAEAAELTSGRHGRARPTYGHLFKPLSERRRRKRDPETGELMPLSDEEEGGFNAPESSEEKLKRRRRKRHPVAGELMLLSDEKEGSVDATELSGDQLKRRRRKRHPLTGELMPLGWRYDPNAPNEKSGSTATIAVSPAMKHLSLSQEPTTKRMKLAHPVSSPDSSPARVVLAAHVSSSESSDFEQADGANALGKFKAKAMGPSGMLGRVRGAATVTTSASESSPPPNTMTTPLHANAKEPSGGDESEDELGEGEFVIEAILAHHLSDPRTHPPELGKTATMLYEVKWEGWTEPTWEPADSFTDRSILDEYQRRSGLLRDDDGDRDMDEDDVLTDAQRSGHVHADESGSEGDIEDSAEDAYVVETILSHHMYDPRTHGAGLGKESVMLYEVKWKGYEKPTWEPLHSFDDLSVVDRYRDRAGLLPLASVSRTKDAAVQKPVRQLV